MSASEDNGSPPAGGGVDVAQQIGASALGLVRTRLELLGVELQEEKLRLVSLLVWLAVAVTLIAAGLLVTIGTLALLLWDEAGYLGLAGLAGLTLAAGAGLLWWLRRRVRRGPGPFAATIGEFKKDIQCLRPSP
ncbi:phage holin family protein [Opitutus sp. ER46]|uniref:phage holin family protein n=1 Tax=Opitutus sp. ER46 TaxID=2161864 RepID=UPI000D30D142|nr:phage holin family protein [Opitutus sp. ER46]PTX98590.1 hypothetical protein DB354_04820 [Opitutus sp. ER46]